MERHHRYLVRQMDLKIKNFILKFDINLKIRKRV